MQIIIPCNSVQTKPKPSSKHRIITTVFPASCSECTLRGLYCLEYHGSIRRMVTVVVDYNKHGAQWMVVMVLIVSAHLSPGRGRFLISFSERLLRTLGYAFVLSWSGLLVVLFLLMTLETIIFSSCSNKLHRPRNMLTIGHGSHHQVLVYFKSGNWHRHHHHQKHQHHPPTTQSVS